MAPLTQLLAVATLAGLTAALPPHVGTADLADVVSGGTASLKQVRREEYKFNGAVSIYKTYLKYGLPIPDYLHDAVARTGHVKRSTGTVVATPIDPFGDEYWVPVSIGTPAQVLHLIPDTGSSDTWAFSSLTPSSEVKGQNRYDPKKSSTAKLQPSSTWEIMYGDGSSSSGLVYTDKMDIGGVIVSNQAVEAANNVSDEFTDLPSVDGLLGLGFGSANQVRPRKVKTFFDNAKASLDAALFTADLRLNSSGVYNFGYIDPSVPEGDITYVPVDTDHGFWNFSSSGYAIASESFVPLSIAGIADTGTALLYLPLKTVNAYYAKVPGAVNSTDYGGYVFPCNATLPSFTFGVDQARITIPGTYINAGPAEDGANSSIPCFGGIQWGGRLNIFGEVALKAAFVVFKNPDDESPTLGWANKKLR